MITEVKPNEATTKMISETLMDTIERVGSLKMFCAVEMRRDGTLHAEWAGEGSPTDYAGLAVYLQDSIIERLREE